MRAGRTRWRGAWTLVLIGIVALLVSATGLTTGEPAAKRGGGAPLFGYNEDWGPDDDRFMRASAGGADVSRAVISWSAVEPRRGRETWDHYDRLYERMVEAGTRPLWVLADAPCWAWARKVSRCRKKDQFARPPDKDHDDDWADFAAGVVERYPETAAVASWNEPNLVDFWKPRPDVKRAAQITAAADKAIRKVDPDVPVLFGGLAPLYETIPEKREIAYDEFLRDAYDAMGRGHWDGVAMHPFPRFRNRDGFLRDIVDHLKAVRKALAKSRARGTPIWVTEIGLSTAGPFPYTAEEQADGLVRIYKRLAGMPDVPAIIVHRLVDVAESDRAEAGWGVIRADGDPKPAYCAVAKLRDRECPAASAPTGP
jgi:polysaccharide biosynthesis protein PslG